MIGSPGAAGAANSVASGPCGAARAEVDSRCAEAERLAHAAAAHQRRLRDARLHLAEVVEQHELDAQMRDRRSLNEAKTAARDTYRAALRRAADRPAVEAAAAAWLIEIHRLNGQVRNTERHSDEVARQAAQVEGSLAGIEMAADAARIAAEAAQAACLEARRTLAACEEDAQRRTGSRNASDTTAATASATFSPTALPIPRPAERSQTKAGSARDDQTSNTSAASAPRPALDGAPLTLLLRGDRQAVLGLTLRLAEETGIEAGRLQLLLLEFREAVASRALDEQALRFPVEHAFWGQLTTEEARRVAVSLKSLGFQFDGVGGWADGRAPAPRDFTVALSHAGHDARSLRRPAGQAAIDALWQGTTVLVEDYLLTRAPDLNLTDVTDALGPRAPRLGELWDNWGRLRPLLVAQT